MEEGPRYPGTTPMGSAIGPGGRSGGPGGHIEVHIGPDGGPGGPYDPIYGYLALGTPHLPALYLALYSAWCTWCPRRLY